MVLTQHRTNQNTKQCIIQQAMHYIDDTPDIETRIELIKTLNNVSAGKVNAFDLVYFDGSST